MIPCGRAFTPQLQAPSKNCVLDTFYFRHGVGVGGTSPPVISVGLAGRLCFQARPRSLRLLRYCGCNCRNRNTLCLLIRECHLDTLGNHKSGKRSTDSELHHCRYIASASAVRRRNQSCTTSRALLDLPELSESGAFFLVKHPTRPRLQPVGTLRQR